MPRGVIMSISDREAVILTRDREFVKIALPEGEYDLGQEIEAESSKNNLVQKWIAYGGRRLVAAAAVLLIAVILPAVATTVFLNNAVYAYVTLDINPSTEFSINGKERIISVQPLNEEGAAVLEGSSLRGRDIQFAIEYFVEKACELGFASAGNEGAVVATTVMEKEKDAGLEEKISATIDRTVEQNNLNAKTGVLSATKEIKEEADKAGVSAGKYLIALQASDDQLEVDIEDVKNSSIVSAINNAGGNLESILKRARKTNEELEKLFEKNQERIQRSSGRDDNPGNGNDKTDNRENRDENTRDNNGWDRNNYRWNGDGSNNDKNSRNTQGSSRESGRNDDKARIRDKWNDDSGRDNNNGRANTGNRDNRERNGRDNGARNNNNGRDNSDREDRRDDRDRPDKGNTGNGQVKRNNRKQNEVDYSKAGGMIKNIIQNRRNAPVVLEDIIKQMFNKKPAAR